ncbi:CCA tRNA nucleotidyltransferase [Acidithiobacillus sp.]|uniref:CCA tRNA nucleotidyltransferase n=1 Tax=Acidithiobacillus sp. TaxID=1872118 RepID=UPI00261E168F|nr:CCA tRNA nucleotidyltransferase [Acidithiobacillus sp.]MDD5278290.1 CCA tRNA nucleotidyltransferase [Acidithiobacillus sp.]
MEADSANLLPLLEKQWGAARLDHLRQIGRIAQQLGTPAYLVGGAVRDLFLKRYAPDLDVAVEGDTRMLAEACKAQIHGAHYQFHAQFGTAILEDSQGVALDLARCRLEHYSAPAALPEVSPGNIHADLARRDFTVNAMAIRLDPQQFGILLDPYDGQADLQAGLLRTLHSRSFLDDPTRILRGLRFATRFQMDLAPECHQQLKQALQADIFTQLSGARLWRELRYLLELEALPSALSQLTAWKLWFLLRPTPPAINTMQTLLQRGQEQIQWLRAQFPDEPLAIFIPMLTLIWHDVPLPDLQHYLDRWPVPDRGRLLADLQVLPGLPDTLLKANRPSQKANIWQGVSVAGILAAMAVYADNTTLVDSARLYLQVQRRLPSPFNGQELQTLGLKAGPSLGKTLKSLREAQLDGEISNKENAQQWLIKQGILPPNPL